jgi:hypothetical protein
MHVYGAQLQSRDLSLAEVKASAEVLRQAHSQMQVGGWASCWLVGCSSAHVHYILCGPTAGQGSVRKAGRKWGINNKERWCRGGVHTPVAAYCVIKMGYG